MKGITLYDIKEHFALDEAPSKYLIKNREHLKNTPLERIYDLQKVEQEPKFHPEGNVWNHTVQVVDNAAKLKKYANKINEFMFAAMLHDIGKGATTKRNKDGKLISYNHDEVGAKLVEEILKRCDSEFLDISYVSKLVKYHMHHLYIVKNLPYGNTEEMIKEANLNDLVLLFICDRLGRNQKTVEEKMKEINDINKILIYLKTKYNITLENIENNFRNIINSI